jgi:hypothetical protein
VVQITLLVNWQKIAHSPLSTVKVILHD